VIAAVNGMAVGGGFELALACHLVVAVDDAQFWLPETRVGVVADAACLRLPKRIPYARAMELLLTGRKLDAVTAAAWGLVNHVVARSELQATANSLARQIVAGAPLAVASVLEIANATENLSLGDGYAVLDEGKLPNYRRMLRSEDAVEGPKAFAEKRTAVWRGR
jgi:crotonobetainyl-CoA hydratase